MKSPTERQLTTGFRWVPYYHIVPSPLIRPPNATESSRMAAVLYTGMVFPKTFWSANITKSCQQHAAVRYSVKALMFSCFRFYNLSTLTKIDRVIAETKKFSYIVLDADSKILNTNMVLLSQVFVSCYRNQIKETFCSLNRYLNLRAASAAYS